MNRLALLASVLFTGSVAASEPSFRADVAPLLAGRCISCHSGPKAKGGYKLQSWSDLLTPGNLGETPLTPSKPDESELLNRLTHRDANLRMPPDDEPLSTAEIATVRRWIAAGAKFDGPAPTALIRSYLPPRNHPPAPERYPATVPVFALAFAPGGTEIAIGGVNEVTIRNATTGKIVRRLPGLPARIQSLAFSPDGSRLLVGGGTPSEYGEATLVDPRNPAKRTVLGVYEDMVLAVAFSADGKTAVAGGADRSVRAFRTTDGKELWRAAFHSDWITSAAINPDGRFVATASKDRTVKVLDAATGKLFTTYNGHRRQYGSHTGQFEVYGVGFDASGIAYSAGAGAAVRVWEPVKAQEENGSAIDMEARFAKAGHTQYLDFTASRPVFALAISEGMVFTAAGDGKVRQHDVKSAKIVREYTGPTDWLYAVAADRTGKLVASAGFDGVVWIWNTATGEPVIRFQAAPGWDR